MELSFSRHGCETGDTLTLEHLISREEKEIRVVRVADKQSQVAVEFTSSAPAFGT